MRLTLILNQYIVDKVKSMIKRNHKIKIFKKFSVWRFNCKLKIKGKKVDL